VQRAFLFNLFLLVLINLLVKPLFIFGVDLRVQNLAAPGAYGLYFALLNGTYLLQIVHDFGLQNFNTRLVSQSPHLQAKYFPRIVRLKGLLTLVYMAAGLFFVGIMGGYSGAERGLLAVLLVNQVLTGFVLLGRSSVAGLGHYTTDSLLSALDKLLMLFLCGGVLWWFGASGASGGFPMWWFALTQTVALVLTLGVVGVVLWRVGGWPAAVAWRWSWQRERRLLVWLLRKSLPYALVILLMSTYSRLDGLLLERWHPQGALEADLYAGAFRLLDAANMFGYLFATLLMPMFARLIGRGESVGPLTGQSFGLIWMGSLSLCVAVTCCRVPLCALMFEQQVAARADVLGILIWAFLATSTTYIFSTLLTADARLMAMNRWFLVGIGLDWALNLWLVPRYGAIGSAWASVLTQLLVAGAMLVLCLQIYGFRPRGSAFGIGLAATLLLPLLAWYGVMRWPIDWWWQMAAILSMGGVAALLMLDIRLLRRVSSGA
jgi:O-antigen/teichoic acid export membrane protein